MCDRRILNSVLPVIDYKSSLFFSYSAYSGRFPSRLLTSREYAQCHHKCALVREDNSRKLSQPMINIKQIKCTCSFSLLLSLSVLFFFQHCIFVFKSQLRDKPPVLLLLLALKQHSFSSDIHGEKLHIGRFQNKASDVFSEKKP